MFLPYLAETNFRIARKLSAYSLAYEYLTSYYSLLSILLPTMANIIFLGPLI